VRSISDHTSPPRSWLAVRGKSPEAIRNELRLRESSLAGDDKLKFQIVGASSDAGWYLIVARGRDHRLIHESLVKNLSLGCEVLTCTAEEQVIFSAATCWRDGSRVWSVTYEGEEGATDVVIEGDLPFAFSAIHAQFTAQAQAEDAGDALVDPMFEIPVEMVRSVIGYKPYDANSGFAGRYKLLEGLDTPWWKRWTVGG
jgi:hypothetical protein